MRLCLHPVTFVYPNHKGPSSAHQRWGPNERGRWRAENRRRKRQSQTSRCGECRRLKIGQLPLEGAIILHRGSLSSFPPSAKHAGLNTLTSEDLLHLKVAAILWTADGGSTADPMKWHLKFSRSVIPTSGASTLSGRVRPITPLLSTIYTRVIRRWHIPPDSKKICTQV